MPVGQAHCGSVPSPMEGTVRQSTSQPPLLTAQLFSDTTCVLGGGGQHVILLICHINNTNSLLVYKNINTYCSFQRNSRDPEGSVYSCVGAPPPPYHLTRVPWNRGPLVGRSLRWCGQPGSTQSSTECCHG